MRKLRVIGAVACLVFVVTSVKAQAPAERDRFRPDIYGIHLRMADAPNLNKLVSLEIHALPLENTSATKISVDLPEGIVARSETSFTLDLLRDQAAACTVQLEVQRPGQYMLSVHASTPSLPGQDRSYYFFIESSASGARASDKAFTPVATPASGTVAPLRGPKALAAAGAAATAPANVCGTGSVTVSGSWTYVGDQAATKPLRQVTAELREGDATNSTLLVACNLDDAGMFGFALTFTGTKSLFVRIYADATPAKVLNGDNLADPVYTRDSTIVAVDAANPASWNLGTFAIGNTDSPPFQAVDNVVSEWKYVLDNSGDQLSNKVLVHYPSTHCTAWGCAGWPCASGTNIYLPDKFVNGCSWSRYTLYHEYGHNVQVAFAPISNLCPTMEHSINTTACESFALVEGWADFMEAVVENNPSVFVSSLCRKSTSGYDNFETNYWWKGSSCSDANYGRAVEGAVASALWDILDAPSSDDDALQLGFNNNAGSLWQILKTNKPQGITEFWDKWVSAYGNVSEMANLMKDNTGVGLGPIVRTDYPTVAGTAVSLNALVNPNGAAATAWFDYSATSDFASASRIDAQALASGTTSQAVSADSGPMVVGTPYYLRAAASNGNGTNTGMTIKIDAPTVTTGPASNITDVGVKMSGTVASNSLATSFYFEWGTDPTLARSTSSSNYSQPASATTTWNLTKSSGLTSGTTYYYRIGAFNAWGASKGAILNFTTTGGTGPFQLTVSKAGAGTGTVTSSPAGIDCGSICSATFIANTSVTLTATAASGSTFSSWAGCDSTSGNTCTIDMSSAKTVTATFSGPMFPLSVSKSGTGTGTVTSSPAGIDCGSVCSVSFSSGTSVTLTATAAPGSTFTSWTGCDSSSGSNCTVTVTSARAVTVTFGGETATNQLTISKSGTGTGTVTSSPAGIECGSTCSASFTTGTTVTVTANAASGSTFTTWSGCDSSSGNNCTLAMTADKAVTAAFSDTAAPSVSITSHSSGASVAGAVTLTASATDNVGVSGVQFKVDGANLGSELTTAPYSLTWDTTRTVNGGHNLIVTARDAAGNTTTSAAVTLTITNSTEFVFSLPSGGSSSATVSAGSSANYSLQLTPTTGFSGSVTLTCTEVPQAATCTPSPSTASVSGKDATSITINVTTTKRSATNPVRLSSSHGSLQQLDLLWSLSLLPAIVWLSGASRARNALRCVSKAALLFVLLALLVSCGGGSDNGGGGGGGGGTSGTPAGTYTLTVSGTSGSVTHTFNLTLTVN